MSTRQKHIASLLVIFLIVAIPVELTAKERRGIVLKIRKKNGQIILGELIAVRVKQKSLVLMEKFKETDVTVNIHNIKVVIFKKRFNAGRGFWLGVLVGGLYGLERRFDFPYQVAVAGGFYGAIFGFFSAIVLGRRMVVEGKSDTEIEEILQNLQKKSRIPDYN